jgi:hypothetical protein
MARFPHYRENVVALGKLLAEARINPAVRASLKKSPEKELARIGLPTNVTALMNFSIVDEPGNTTIAVPFKLNDDLVRSNDPAYLTSIARNFLHTN